jgi:hypothetical protein
MVGGMSACAKKDSATGQQPPSAATPAPKPDRPVTGSAGQLPTLADYIKQNDITETPANRDDPDVPKIEMPMPPGWVDAGSATPAYAYNAIVGADPALQPDPPTIVAVLSKLTGKVDPAQILAIAPNELRNLPDFNGSDPEPGKISNFDGVAIIGTYTRNGQKRVIEQVTVVIPAKEALWVLQLNGDGVYEQTPVIEEITGGVMEKARITV